MIRFRLSYESLGLEPEHHIGGITAPCLSVMDESLNLVDLHHSSIWTDFEEREVVVEAEVTEIVEKQIERLKNGEAKFVAYFTDSNMALFTSNQALKNLKYLQELRIEGT